MDPIKAIEDALAAGPTPGPWYCDEDGVHMLHPSRFRTILSTNLMDDQRATDAAYIAACHPEAIRSLLDRLREAEADARRWREFRDIVAVEDMAQVIDAAAEFGSLHTPAEEESRKAEVLLDRWIATKETP